MIVSMNVSHFVKICRVLTILAYTNLSVGVSLILGHGVVFKVKLQCIIVTTCLYGTWSDKVYLLGHFCAFSWEFGKEECLLTNARVSTIAKTSNGRVVVQDKVTAERGVPDFFPASSTACIIVSYE